MSERPVDYCMAHEEGRGLGADERTESIFMCAPYVLVQRGECITTPMRLQVLWLIMDNHMLMGRTTRCPNKHAALCTSASTHKNI